ncbi:hypothetical protein DFQ28_011653 [Apophysomyces sp. BC1034]|nr:hypothetical protein DFQ28_011653 [Apophysomyces sp. BC1034]
MGGDYRTRVAVHGRVPDPVGPDGRRVLGRGRDAVLRVLRGDADPDVPDHRGLGRPEPRVRGVQVLPVHAGRLAADAGRVDLPVHAVAVVRAVRMARAATRHDAAGAAVRRILPRVRREGADVAGAYMVAGCARRGADRRLRRAGGDHAEARRVRLPAFLVADRAGCEPPARAGRDYAVAGRGDLYRLRRAGAGRHEEARRSRTWLGVEGAIVQMISHGFVSGAMFLCIGVLYDRVHSRQIADYGGVVNTMPKFAALAMLFSMANCGLPGTSGFVGEFMVILSAVKFNFWIGFLAAITLILGAAYTLWMYKRVYFGAVANDHVAKLVDVNRREFWMLMVLALLVLYMGIFPKPFTNVMHESVTHLLSHVAQSKLPATPQ